MFYIDILENTFSIKKISDKKIEEFSKYKFSEIEDKFIVEIEEGNYA